jgi:hypothetical protein
MRGGGRVDVIEVDGLMGGPMFKLDDILLALVIDNRFKPSIAYSRGHGFQLSYSLLNPCLDKTSALVDELMWVETQRHDRRYEELLKPSGTGFWRSTNKLQVGERVEEGIVGIKGCVVIHILPNGFRDIV